MKCGLYHVQRCIQLTEVFGDVLVVGAEGGLCVDEVVAPVHPREVEGRVAGHRDYPLPVGFGVQSVG